MNGSIGLRSALFLLALVPSIVLAADPALQVWFGPRAPGAADGLDTHFIAFLGETQKTLDGAFYEIRLDPIVDAFIAARKRGVKIRLVVDDANFYGKDALGKINKRTRNPFVKKLIDGGVQVKQDNNRRSLMHNKFAISDGKRVWTGSYNLTDTCSYNNANNALLLQGEEIAKVYSRQFDEMFVKDQWGRSRTSTAAEQKVAVGGQPVEILFAPEDDPQTRQIELLKNAKHAVYFMQFAFTSEEVSDVLVAKAKAGLTVKGIFDHSLYRSTGPYGEFTKLTSGGIPTIVWSNPHGKFHHKVFVIDPGEEGCCVITGSENTSNNGNNQNDENVAILYDREIVDRYFQEFTRLFGSTAKTSADLIYDESPIAGGSIDEIDLYVYGNGQAARDVSIEFPARWALSTETVSSMTVSIGGQPVPADRIKLSKNRVDLKGVGLEATGARGLLLIQLHDVAVPEIPGGYGPLISVSGEGGKMEPLTSQPVIQVYDPKSPDFMVKMCDGLQKQLRSLSGVENMPGADIARFKKAWQADFDRMRRTVVTAATKGQWPTIDAALTMFEGLEPAERAIVGELTDGARELKRALTAQAASSDEAKQLLARLRKVLGRDMK